MGGGGGEGREKMEMPLSGGGGGCQEGKIRVGMDRNSVGGQQVV